MPVLLILLFGYGLSLDVKNVPVAVVMEDLSRPMRGTLRPASSCHPISTCGLTTSMPHAAELMLARKVDGIVRIRSDFSRNLAMGDVRGASDRARRRRQHGAASSSPMRRARSPSGPRARPRRARTISSGPVAVASRLWFNEFERQPLLPRAGPRRAGHDLDRSAAHRYRHGPRVGARNLRSDVRHASPVRTRSCSARRRPTSSLGMIGLVPVHLLRASSCFTSRCAARLWC